MCMFSASHSLVAVNANDIIMVLWFAYLLYVIIGTKMNKLYQKQQTPMKNTKGELVRL